MRKRLREWLVACGLFAHMLASPAFRKTMAWKMIITGCLLAVFVYPMAGQWLSAIGGLIWLWVKVEQV